MKLKFDEEFFLEIPRFFIKVYLLVDRLHMVKKITPKYLKGPRKHYDKSFSRDNFVLNHPFEFAVNSSNTLISNYAIYHDMDKRLMYAPIAKMPRKTPNPIIFKGLKRGFVLNSHRRYPVQYTLGLIKNIFCNFLKIKPRRKVEKSVLICSHWIAYGHFIHDTLPIIQEFISKEDTEYSEFKDAKIVIPSKMDYYKGLLTELGFDLNRFIFIGYNDRIVSEKTLLISIGHIESPKIHEHLSTLSYKVKDPEIKGPKRIFIDRKDTNRAVINNSKNRKIYDLIKEFDIEPVVLEELSFKEQINFLNNAEFVMGFHGSGFANLHFTKNKIDAMIIYNDSRSRVFQERFDRILPSNVNRYQVISEIYNPNIDLLREKLSEILSDKPILLQAQKIPL